MFSHEATRHAGGSIAWRYVADRWTSAAAVDGQGAFDAARGNLVRVYAVRMESKITTKRHSRLKVLHATDHFFSGNLAQKLRQSPDLLADCTMLIRHDDNAAMCETLFEILAMKKGEIAYVKGIHAAPLFGREGQLILVRYAAPTCLDRRQHVKATGSKPGHDGILTSILVHVKTHGAHGR